MNHVDRGDQRRAYQGYDHAIRRGAWQALAWAFLLDVVLVNSFLLQLHGQPHWKRYTNQKDWRRRMYNELFKAFYKESQPWRRFRVGDEFTPVAQHTYVQRGKKGNCVACQGYQLGRPRSRSSMKLLGLVSSNKRRHQSRWGCKQCDVAICPRCPSKRIGATTSNTELQSFQTCKFASQKGLLMSSLRRCVRLMKCSEISG